MGFVLRAPHREGRDHLDKGGTETRSDGRGTPAARDRRRRTQLADEHVEGHVAETRDGWLHRPIVRLRLGFSDPYRTSDRESARGTVEAKADGEHASERTSRCVSEQRSRQRTHRPPLAPPN